VGTIHYLSANGDCHSETATAVPGRDACEQFLAGGRERVWVLFKGKRTCMLVNDEGALMNLPINDSATDIYREWPRKRGMHVEDRHIYGNAMVLEDIDVD
jgi:hypothetical protein